MAKNETEIELSDEQKKSEEPSTLALPMNLLSFGSIGQDDVKVYLRQDVYKELERFSAEDTDHERGTILLGNWTEEMGKLHVVISHAIEARYTDASASTLTFTHKTWEYVHEEQEKNYPDEKIIGWQHTHPGYGIFLSNYDLFIQENFFNLPFQIAYVIDPIAKTRGFFQWKDGKTVKLDGYYLFDEVGVPIKIEREKVAEKEKEETEPASSKKTLPLFVLMGALIILLAGGLLLTNAKLDRQITDFRVTSTRLTDAEAKLEALREENSEKIASAEEKIEEQKALLDSQQELLNALQKEKEETVRFRRCTVEKGDTLSRICERMGVSYRQNAALILRINGIEDANRIFVGQTLLIPVQD